VVIRANEVDRPALGDHLYDHIRDRCYDDRPAPMVFRHSASARHFTVRPDESVPMGTIELPYGVADDMCLDTVPAIEQVLLVKPSHANVYTDTPQHDPHR